MGKLNDRKTTTMIRQRLKLRWTSRALLPPFFLFSLCLLPEPLPSQILLSPASHAQASHYYRVPLAAIRIPWIRLLFHRTTARTMLQQCCSGKVACANFAACQDFVHAAAYGGGMCIFATDFGCMGKPAVYCTMLVQIWAPDRKIKGEKRRGKEGPRARSGAWRMLLRPFTCFTSLSSCLPPLFPSPAFTRHHGTFQPCDTKC